MADADLAVDPSDEELARDWSLSADVERGRARRKGYPPAAGGGAVVLALEAEGIDLR